MKSEASAKTKFLLLAPDHLCCLVFCSFRGVELPLRKHVDGLLEPWATFWTAQRFFDLVAIEDRNHCMSVLQLLIMDESSKLLVAVRGYWEVMCDDIAKQREEYM